MNRMASIRNDFVLGSFDCVVKTRSDFAELGVVLAGDDQRRYLNFSERIP